MLNNAKIKVIPLLADIYKLQMYCMIVLSCPLCLWGFDI